LDSRYNPEIQTRRPRLDIPQEAALPPIVVSVASAYIGTRNGAATNVSS
jgi:hypothetical protein